MGYLETMVERLTQYDVFQGLLPFLLIYILSYAALLKVKLFGEKDEALNHVLAFIIAMFSVLNFASNDPSGFFASLLSRAGTIIVVALMGYIVLNALKGGKE
jgi:hypothetical protein